MTVATLSMTYTLIVSGNIQERMVGLSDQASPTFVIQASFVNPAAYERLGRSSRVVIRTDTSSSIRINVQQQLVHQRRCSPLISLAILWFISVCLSGRPRDRARGERLRLRNRHHLRRLAGDHQVTEHFPVAQFELPNAPPARR